MNQVIRKKSPIKSHLEFLPICAILATSAVAAPATAQTTAANDANRDENTIIVTAQRRAEALENVPMTVTAISSEGLAAAGVTDIRDLSAVVTGYQLGQGGAYPQPAVRGVTTIINGTSFENNVAVYIDGFYQIAPQAIGIDLPNVATSRF